MRTDRTSSPGGLCLVAIALALASAAAARPTSTSAPASTRPTTRPGPARISDNLQRKWRYYKLTWAGNSLQNQSLSDQQLVAAMLAGDPQDVAALRELMTAEYNAQAARPTPDDFHCGRLASRLAVAWTRVPQDKKLPAVQLAVNRKRMCDEVVRWAVRALEHFAGQIPDHHWKRYKVFLPGTAASMLSLIPSRAAWTDDPATVRARLIGLRGRLQELLLADEGGQRNFKDQFNAFYAAIDPLGRRQADKQAVCRLLASFRTAYNRRDDKAFTALWPDGHKATRSLKNRSLASRIPPPLWKIVRWDVLYVVFKGDRASAYVVSEYRAKDGTVQEAKLQGFPAKKDAKAGWKLN